MHVHEMGRLMAGDGPNDTEPGWRGAERTEAYLRRMAETRLRRARSYPRSQSPASSVREEVRQVWAVAAALVSAGVLDEARALPVSRAWKPAWACASALAAPAHRQR